MSQEIIDAVHEIERDKGIEEGALVAALEDALLAAYKKTAGASIRSLTRCPTKRAKCSGRRRGRSGPGDDTSTSYSRK